MAMDIAERAIESSANMQRQRDNLLERSKNFERLSSLWIELHGVICADPASGRAVLDGMEKLLEAVPIRRAG